MVTDEEVQDTGQKAKKLEMSEKEITFLETTKFTKRPRLLFPVVVFIIQWIPWILACFLSFFISISGSVLQSNNPEGK